MKRSFLVIAAILFVFLAASAFAGPVPIRVELSAAPDDLVGAADTVMPNADFTLDFYFTQSSGDICIGFSCTWEIYSPDSLEVVTYRDIGGTLGNPVVPSVKMLNGFEGTTYWNTMNSLYAHDWDGALPDTLHYFTIGIPFIPGVGGWPEGPEEMYIQIGMTSAEEGTFCVDSINRYISFYDWAWGDGFEPTFEGTNVGHCFVVNDPTNAFNEHGDLIPDNWGLGQNYPNPFNPATTIDFEVPYQSNVAITVYNVLGQKIKTIVDKEYVAGFYSETWDGNADNGGPAASGIYFYKLEGDNFTNTRKMMLLK